MTPDKYTISESFLDVGDGHQLYIYDWGNPKAKIPILFLHGGPGSGFDDGYKQRYVPEQQRVIFFDQRGAGKSIPQGELLHNTTQNLVEDIEKIAKHLKLEKFILVGGSWGSCLALAYAIKYPKRIAAMVLSGIYTGTKEENDFINEGGFQPFFPDVWGEYISHTPKQWQDNPSEYHFKMVLGKDEKKAKQSAYVFGCMEAGVMRLDDRFTPDNYEEFDPTSSKIEMYFIKNNCFLPDGYIMESVNQLTMPVWLVQGRYDMVCPPKTAYELSKRIPNCELIWTTAGHGNDRPNYDAVRTILLQMTKE